MKEKALVGIKAIAQEAGVAISTVSCALNNTGNLSTATRERVLAIARRHHYQPSFVAKSLKRQQTGVIALLLASFDGEFYSDLIMGVESSLREAGLELMICHGSGAQRVLSEGLFDGLIILDGQFSNEMILRLVERGKKIVVLDRPFPHASVSQICLNNAQGCGFVWQDLMKLETERFICITGPLGNYDGDQRRLAIENLSREHALAVDWYEGNFSKESGYLVAKEIFGKVSSGLKVIFAFNDNMALGVYEYMREQSLFFGEDAVLIGFDGLQINQYLQPSLASIGYDRRFWGYQAGKSLLDLLAGKESISLEIDTYLVSGASWI
ncbi:LacI family DNA-binding transcriptional regulator [Entomospira culicis]|nr:LacI family DNA-binding transcriptional regulator [Entomospira culicis]WDI36509.1 LacI family DNA-binding transcriptional regulator [Entomospira culicis]